MGNDVHNFKDILSFEIENLYNTNMLLQQDHSVTIDTIRKLFTKSINRYADIFRIDNPSGTILDIEISGYRPNRVIIFIAFKFLSDTDTMIIRVN